MISVFDSRAAWTILRVAVFEQVATCDAHSAMLFVSCVLRFLLKCPAEICIFVLVRVSQVFDVVRVIEWIRVHGSAGNVLDAIRIPANVRHHPYHGPCSHDLPILQCHTSLIRIVGSAHKYTVPPFGFNLRPLFLGRIIQHPFPKFGNALLCLMSM